MKEHQKTLIMLMGTLLIFFIILLLLALSFTFVLHGDETKGIMKIFIDYHIHFMILLGIVGGIVGGIAYYGFTEQKKDLQKTHEQSKKLLYRFLDVTERKIIEQLLKKTMSQAQIAKIQGIGKVKAHRTIQKLQQKELINITPKGKTKEIDIKKEIKKLLK